ncbi:MAG: N-acetylmuramoyl-L-alanine amidase [Bacillota bacterium]|nr:N-acetylmuramoyl-L-alanine amidase [Bacillota bacterium]
MKITKVVSIIIIAAAVITFPGFHAVAKISVPEAMAAGVVDVVVDPGHGGIDSGTSSGSLEEKNITLDISNKLEKYLEDGGYNTILTRTSDTSLYKLSTISGTEEKRDLNSRVNIINGSKAKLFISVHVNSFTKYPDYNGSIVYYNDKVKGSRDLAVCIQKSLNALTINGKPRMAHNSQVGNFYITNNTNIPGVLVETAFISNSTEKNLLKTAAFRTSIAKAIAKGVNNYKAALSVKKGYLAVCSNTAAGSMTFSSEQQAFDWIKNKAANGIVYTDSLPRTTLGVVLEGYHFDFSEDYLIDVNIPTKASDPKVKAIQKRLAAIGYNMPVTGIVGTITLGNIKKFQVREGLTADGIIGKQTYQSLAAQK